MNKRMTIFEINDDGREREAGKYTGYTYEAPFFGFILSLFPDAYLNSNGNTIIIDDVPFKIDSDNASYASKNIYTRETKPRKPENRFVALSCFGQKIKIRINKEYEADVLIARIRSEIDKHKANEQAIVDRKDKARNNTTAVAEHILSALHDEELVQSLYHIRINDGKIYIKAKDCELTTNVLMDFKGLSIYLHDCNTNDATKLDEMFERLEKMRIIGNKLSEITRQVEPLSDELSNWVNSEVRYEHRYDVKDRKYSD